MLIDATVIRTLIPHTGPMCLLDRVQAWDAERIRCIATSHRLPDNPMRRQGRLGIACGIEYGAQAMAVHGALTAPQGQLQQPGYLASVRDARCHAGSLEDCDDELVIDAQLLLAEGTRMIYAFSLSCGGRALIEGRAAVVLGAVALGPGPAAG